MANALNPDLKARQEYPYAVGVRLPYEDRTEYVHFNNTQVAMFYASLFASTHEVTRWVAITEPEYHMSATVPGWRQVSWFSGEMPPVDN